MIWETTRKKKTGKGLSTGDLHIFAALCAYANPQGFAWPNAQTISELCGNSRANCTRAFRRAERLGYIEKVSSFRSHPKWRHVMGTVWRIVYDERLDQEELVDMMNREDPPPVMEEDLPKVEDTGNQQIEVEEDRLVDGLRVAKWYARAAEETTGQLRLVNDRSVELAAHVLKKGLSEADIKARAQTKLDQCRNQRQSTPPDLGFLLN